jgi:predicted GH43/DUF377 family glycosyl hydrolase
MGPFVRSTAVNPIIRPDITTLFLDPVLNDSVAWESDDTFNPGDAVLNDEIVVLYRAEDRSGKVSENGLPA